MFAALHDERLDRGHHGRGGGRRGRVLRGHARVGVRRRRRAAGRLRRRGRRQPDRRQHAARAERLRAGRGARHRPARPPRPPRRRHRADPGGHARPGRAVPQLHHPVLRRRSSRCCSARSSASAPARSCPSPSLGLLCVAVIAVAYRPLLLSSLAPESGAARGVRPGRIELLFLVVVALATSMTLPVVGALLIFSLMIGPPAAARSLTASPRGPWPCPSSSPSRWPGSPSPRPTRPTGRSGSSSARAGPSATRAGAAGPPGRAVPPPGRPRPVPVRCRRRGRGRRRC